MNEDHKTFTLYRSKEEDGAVEPVAEGIVFDSGKVAVGWHGIRPSVVVWDSVFDFMAVSFAKPPKGHKSKLSFSNGEVIRQGYDEEP